MLLLYCCDIRSIADSSFRHPSFSTHLSNVKDQNRFWSIWSIGLRMPCGSWTIFSIAKWRRSFFRKLITAQQLRHKMKRRSVPWLAYASLFSTFFPFLSHSNGKGWYNFVLPQSFLMSIMRDIFRSQNTLWAGLVRWTAQEATSPFPVCQSVPVLRAAQSTVWRMQATTRVKQTWRETTPSCPSYT